MSYKAFYKALFPRAHEAQPTPAATPKYLPGVDAMHAADCPCKACQQFPASTEPAAPALQR